ncbi:hypothetical protein DFH07DRAFT_846707 [Mycena maculata]|uniref:HNH nuclease domain-containing protein n=1 Tax=Mycena maculata TaxID=230809 RepID=A0AAD7I0A9_9AGAR|nr:hypothetical protein DFH07DRAFT_846707 [Mycena maculata]
MSYHDPQPSVFDDDDVEDRDSLSSSEDEHSDKAPSLKPPSNKLVQVSPNGRRCIVTNEEKPLVTIDAAHLLPRATPHELLTRLEFKFGLKYRQMHINTTRNMVFLRVDHHRSFDHLGFILLPSHEVIAALEEFTDNPRNKTYKQHLTQKVFEYRMVPLQLSKDKCGIFRLDISTGAHQQIFPLENPTAFPIIVSHANPFFVVANAGPKLASGFDLLDTAVRGDKNIRADLSAVVVLWSRWSSAQPTAEWMNTPYQRRGRGGRDQRKGRTRHGKGDSSAPRRDPSPAGRRRRAKDSSLGLGPDEGAGQGRPTYGLPELEVDGHSGSTPSEALTEDAVQSVGHLERTVFLQKWLEGDHS